MVKVKIEKYLVTDDDKKFYVGVVISFDYYDKEAEKQFHIICEIMDLTEKTVFGRNVEIDKIHHKDYGVYNIKDISNVNYVYYD